MSMYKFEIFQDRGRCKKLIYMLNCTIILTLNKRGGMEVVGSKFINLYICSYKYVNYGKNVLVYRKKVWGGGGDLVKRCFMPALHHAPYDDYKLKLC